MKTDTLIQKLASQADPVRPLAHPLLRFFFWFSIAVPSVLIGAYVIGFRRDISTAILEISFLTQVVILFVLFSSMAILAFFLCVPDVRNKRAVYAGAVILILWLAAFALPIFLSVNASIGEGIRCLRNVLVLGLSPSLVLYLLLIKAFPLKKDALALVSLISTFGLGCLGTRFICPNDDPLHFFVWHCVPVLVVSAVGIIASWSILTLRYK